jgi:hypothetical protein
VAMETPQGSRLAMQALNGREIGASHSLSVKLVHPGASV